MKYKSHRSPQSARKLWSSKQQTFPPCYRLVSPHARSWRCCYCGDSSVVRAPDSWLKGRGFESLLERRENFFSRVDFLCWLLFRYPFHPRVTAVARKRSRSFCQKCRWQVTAKHAYTLRMWLCMKWHGAWLYGVHRTCAETAAVSCGTNHASVVSTPLRWIFHTHTQKSAIKASHALMCRTTYKRSESAQESGEQRYISDHQSIKLLYSRTTAK